MTRKSTEAPHEKNAIELLKSDHEQVLQLFAKFEKVKDKEDETKRELVEHACSQLTIHAQIEEELFYPALRDVLDERDFLDEALVEHDMAKQLIADLESMEPDEDLYDAKFTVLGEYVKHHIEEEEKEIFAKAKKAGLDMDALGADMRDRKHELMKELGLDIDEEEAQISGVLQSKTKAGKKPARHPRA
ncbi:hemerythrin domain-containing protein [Janthinobacterium sp. 17J80-10]|uniref:hemerythrin domain-containing protein n=1 Tax=Janthinobacterium sp. 17J80-10 TaxID=2497863 RepID=UPI00100594BB|nr:hemerythrin domain-containing protein [Janthinobacterium sp. 17J80-10]QAU34029.1 hemerythrin domain-containing protein [Janthinobacterium sp. 17J80-10]